MDNTDPRSASVTNLKALRGSLALLVMAALLAGTAVAAALHFSRLTTQAHQSALALQSETRAKLARVNEDEREIREKINRYQELIGQGRIAPERRLEWVETLRQIKETRKLAGLDYELAPQRPLDTKMPAAGGYEFLASAMKLEMPLLHENDLLGLFADLSTRVPAVISIKNCKIERTAGAAEQRIVPRLKAQCELDWITLQEKT